MTEDNMEQGSDLEQGIGSDMAAELVQGYAPNLEAAKTSELTACTFRVGSESFSIPLEYVKEITEAAEIFPLPLTPDYVVGLAHLRGIPIPVIDVAKIRNIQEEAATKQLIVLDLGTDKLAIGVREMPDLSKEAVGEMINVQKIYETYRIE